MTDENMVSRLELFSTKERKVMCWLLRDYNDKYPDMHEGMLPFVKVSEVILSCLWNVSAAKNAGVGPTRLVTGILCRLTDRPSDSPVEDITRSFKMLLDSAKVSKRFGARAAIGVPIPILPVKRGKAGLKWSLPEKDYVVDNDATLRVMISVKWDGTGTWKVTCQKQHVKVVREYLEANCG